MGYKQTILDLKLEANLNSDIIIRLKKDCINCIKWDLYCTLGKDKYYLCRMYNFCFFEGG